MNIDEQVNQTYFRGIRLALVKFQFGLFDLQA
jgi:hypothetical protein